MKYSTFFNLNEKKNMKKWVNFDGLGIIGFLQSPQLETIFEEEIGTSTRENSMPRGFSSAL